jgi:hypothetical protein
MGSIILKYESAIFGKRNNMQPESPNLTKKTRISPRGWILLGYALDIIGIISIIIALIVPFQLFLPACSYKDGTFNIPYRATFTDNGFFMVGIIRGMIVRGMILVQGPDNSSINFSINNSEGEAVFGPSIIKGRYFFEFQSQNSSGSYEIILENLTNEPLYVYLIIWLYYYNILFACIGVGVLICGIIMGLLGYDEVRTKAES